MKNFNIYLIGTVVSLALGLGFTGNKLIKTLTEIDRGKANLANITAEKIRDLVLNKKEYNKLNTTWKWKLDSVLNANEIELKRVKGTVIVRTIYRDTGSVKIVYRDVIRMPDNSFKIPVSFDNQCWSMKGEIRSFDANSTLDIHERGSRNSVQKIEIKPRRLLGFLWITKGGEVKAYSDCGEVDVTKIEFVK